MSALAPTTARPPRLPEPLQGRSAVVIAPADDGHWWAWRYVWGQFSGEEPIHVGQSRADVSRYLQGLGNTVPAYVEP
jgi:hypothetical protein